MNKAFVREPDFDGRVYCPQCGSLGVAVNRETLDHHVLEQVRSHLGDTAWFCEFARCEVGYFDRFERVVEVCKLKTAVYPKNTGAPICACFGFTLDDIEADGALRDADAHPGTACHIKITRLALPATRGRRTLLYPRSPATVHKTDCGVE